MRRFSASLICCLICISSIAGCGDESSSSSLSSVLTSQGDIPVIGVCIYDKDDAYVSDIKDALLSEAQNKAELIIKEGDSEQETQNDQVDELIEQGVEVLAINVADIERSQLIVNKARNANIPVVFFNREPDTDVLLSYEYARFVGSDLANAGIIQGQIAIDTWETGLYDRNGDGVLSYVLLQGENDNPDTKARSDYFTEALADSEVNANELATAVCDWDEEKAKETMAKWLSTYPDSIEMIVSNNDEMAIGAIYALNDAGYNTGEEGCEYIPVIGVDATKEARELISKNMMTGTVVQDTAGIAKSVLTLCLNSAAGKDFLNDSDYLYDDTGVAVRIPYKLYEA